MPVLLAVVAVLVLVVVGYVLSRSGTPAPYVCLKPDGSPCGETPVVNLSVKLGAYQATLKMYVDELSLLSEKATYALSGARNRFTLLTATLGTKPTDPMYVKAGQDFLTLVATLQTAVKPLNDDVKTWTAPDDDGGGTNIDELMGAGSPVEDVALNAEKVFDQLAEKTATISTFYSEWRAKYTSPTGSDKEMRDAILSYEAKYVTPLATMISRAKDAIKQAVTAAQALANAATFS